jgi:tetratricopeptide (TPR) repeat protein
MTLTSNLTHLESVGLVRLAAVRPELEFMFRHALIQDAAYNSLLRADRRVLHQLIGETLEAMYPQRVDELAPTLAHHFALAGNDADALKYFTRAGDEAMRVYANAEAIQHYTHALNLAKVLQPSQGLTSQLMRLYTQRGRALELSGRYDEALQNYVEMETLARDYDNGELTLAALVARATVHATPTTKFDPTLARTLCERALPLAHTLQDRAAEAKILWNLSILCFNSGQLADGTQYGEQSLAVARAHNLHEQIALALNDMWRSYVASGQITQAIEMLREVSELWRARGNQPMLTDSLGALSVVYFFKGEYKHVAQSARAALELSQTIRNLWGQSFSRVYLGNVYWEWGEPLHAIETMETCIRLGEQGGFMSPSVQTRADLSLIYAQLGQTAHALQLAQQAVEQTIQSEPMMEGITSAILAQVWIMRRDLTTAEKILTDLRTRVNPYYPLRGGLQLAHAECELALAQGRFTDALTHTAHYLMRLQELGWGSYVADALYLKGCALRHLQRWDEAYTTFVAARESAIALGSRRMLWQIYAALSDLATQCGNPSEAQALRQQAREVIAYIAEHCPPELRASFLDLPDVRHLMDVTR